MATTPTTGALHDRLVSLLDAWMAAIVANDAARIGEFMTDDWTMVSENGITSARDFLGFIASGALTHSAMQRVGDPVIQDHGTVAVVTVRVTNTAHYEGKRYDADEWTTDVYVETAQGWRCSLSHITAVATV
ncbi:nuclear transport factor 2 family protein [Nocardia brasiliensis]|uniref:nuclear transport factor 2 family protein n=1 Tax=Nocardia brasiliensis TaxID=37326 RepID=UPI003D8AD476